MATEKLFTVQQEGKRSMVEEVQVALQRDFHFRKENALKQWPVLTRIDFVVWNLCLQSFSNPLKPIIQFRTVKSSVQMKSCSIA